MNCYVYAHVREDTNEVFYIGIADSSTKYCKNKTKYYRANIRNNRNRYWKSIVNKTAYKVVILHENLYRNDACIIEIKLIAFHGRSDLGYGTLCNLTDGGDINSGYKHTDEFKLKIALFNKTKIIKPITEETRLKMSNSQKSRKHEDATFMSKIRKLIDYEKRKIPVLQYDLDGNFIREFDSAIDAGKILNCHPSNISKCVKNKKRTFLNFIWKYKSDYFEIPLKIEIEKIPLKTKRKVIFTDEKGDILMEFDSILKVSQFLNIKEVNVNQIISRNSKGSKNPRRGYFIKYK